MLEAGEIGAVFTVVDRASATLKGIADQLKIVDAAAVKAKESLTALSSTRFSGLNERILGVDKNLGRVGNQAARVANEMVAGFGRATTGLEEASAKLEAALTGAFTKLDESIAGAVAGMRGMRNEIAGVANQIRSVSGLALPGGGGGGSGGGAGGSGTGGGTGGGGGGRRNIRGGHANGVHWSRMGAGTPGGGHFSLPGGPALAGAAALGYGVYLESEFEDQAARMLLTGQVATPKGMTNADQFKLIRDTLQRISSSTGYDPKEVGEAMLGVERQFGGLPFEKRVNIEETLAPFAASEARLKETNFAESFEALVGLAHMTGTYDPTKLPDLARSFSYASLITPATITQLRGALSYSMPMLHAGLDMDPSSIMFLTAMMQTAGVTSTKSGTWLRSFFENAEPRIGSSKADLAHNSALEKMGLLDVGGKPTWRVDGPDGKVNWDQSILKLSEAINNFTKSTPVDERLGIIKQGFGERGGGFASLMNLDEFIKQFAVLQDKMRSFRGGDDALNYLQENSPVQKFRQTWADMQNLLMDIGQVALPPLNTALREIDNGLKQSKVEFDAAVAWVTNVGTQIAGIEEPADAAALALKAFVSALSAIAGAVSGAIGNIANDVKSLLPGQTPGTGKGVGEGGNSFVPDAYHPPAADKRPIHVQSVLNVDGRQLASVTSKYIVADATHTRQASYADSGHYYSTLDGQISTS